LGKFSERVPYSPSMSRRFHAVIAVVFGLSVFLSLGAEGSCSGSVTLKRAGEPCTRTSECQTGLTCSAGTCRDIGDGAVDAASGDAGP
jgi:hypothetical protein